MANTRKRKLCEIEPDLPSEEAKENPYQRVQKWLRSCPEMAEGEVEDDKQEISVSGSPSEPSQQESVKVVTKPIDALKYAFACLVPGYAIEIRYDKTKPLSAETLLILFNKVDGPSANAPRLYETDSQDALSMLDQLPDYVQVPQPQ